MEGSKSILQIRNFQVFRIFYLRDESRSVLSMKKPERLFFYFTYNLQKFLEQFLEVERGMYEKGEKINLGEMQRVSIPYVPDAHQNFSSRRIRNLPFSVLWRWP